MTVTGPGGIVPPQAPPAPARPAAATATPSAQPGGAATPAAAPDGVSPDVWSVLTAAERAFFLDQAHLGALTYGPTRVSPAAPAPLGTRIDVRA